MNTLSPPTFDGHFWLPNSPESRVSGRFFASTSGALQLDIMGELGAEPDDNEFIHTLHGVATNGDCVSLFNLFYLRRDLFSSETAVGSLRVNLAVLGASWEQRDDFELTEVEFFSEVINAWLRFAPIVPVVDAEKLSSGALHFHKPDRETWEIFPDLSFSLASAITIPTTPSYGEARISQKTWCRFSFATAKPLDCFLDLASKLCNLVSLIAYFPASISEIRVRKLPAQTQSERDWYQLFYQPVGGSEYEQSKFSRATSLFQFSEVRPTFGQLLQQWLDGCERHSSSFSLYFSTRTDRVLMLENRFAMLVQAVESLHRQTSHETTYSPEGFERLATSLRTNSPPEFAEWLEARLRYGNEPSLRRRLKSMLEPFGAIFGSKKRLGELVCRLVDTRNFLTHYDSSLLNKRAVGRDLWKLCELLDCLLQLHFVRRCGFTEDETMAFAKRNRSFERRLRQAL